MLRRRSAPLLMALALGPLVLFAVPRAAAAALTVEGAPLVPLRGSAPLTVVMHPAYDVRSALRKLPSSLDEGPAVHLSIERVKAPGGATIRVFINLPAANADTPTSDFHYVGDMTAFEAPAPGSPGDDFLLDASRTFKRLKKGDRLLLGDNVSVTLVLAPGSAGEDVAIPVERIVLSIESAAGR
jgi:hypothetical protein